jgi:hypothetical protein
MAIIKSGASSDQLTIDATSKGARVTLYDPTGRALTDPARVTYRVPILYTAAAADAAASFVWAIRNGGTKNLRILRARITVGFAGTAAATSSDFELVALTSLSALSGGTALTAAVSDPADAASSVTAIQTNAVLTATGGVVQRTFSKFGAQRQVTAVTSLDLLDMAGNDPGNDVLIASGTGNGLAVRVNATAVIGDFIRGHVLWEEF